MATAPLKLYWQNQLVGHITEATFSDFPCVIGRFEARRVTKRLREVLVWFLTQADADELGEPPFESNLLDGWVILDPDGNRTELLMPPLIDFESETVEWR